MQDTPAREETSLVDSAYAWRRLIAALLISTVANAGMWTVVVVLPAVQTEFGVVRADASLPYTLTMVCFALGGILMGRLADRFGVVVPLLIGAFAIGLGYIGASMSTSIWHFALIHGLVIGLGCSAGFGPLIADTSMWFRRRRGLAVSICASGNYLSGVVWPPIVQYITEVTSWRQAYFIVGVAALAIMLPLILAVRRPTPVEHVSVAAASAANASSRPLGFSPNTLMGLLMLAGVACCVAMSMPQVHMVAYCADLGYGAARGAEMLSLMLACGIVSRLISGWITDRIGGLAVLLLGTTLQMVALLLYLPFDGLMSLYIISALFGLFQGGIVPAYAIIVRENFPPKEAGGRVGYVLMSTIAGMALGGWISGAIFDYTGSYQAAFLNGIAWNVLNVSIVLWLMSRRPRGPQLAGAAA
jgi:MFS family permease